MNSIENSSIFVQKEIMTSVQLKKNIIDKLQSIDDVSFLEALNTIIDAKSAVKSVRIKPDFEEELLKRKKNIENG